MPAETDQIRSFELFRGNSKNVEIVTFDELLEKIKELRELLFPREIEQKIGDYPLDEMTPISRDSK